MFFKEWEVLLVDDEPDVLTISKLAMRSFQVYGLPLRILTAGSKAEALAVMAKTPRLLPTIAVGFIDVVMETDTAGLDLCEAIRNQLKNKITQLIVRTGQPGVYPERQVIDSYDINAYYTKIEATEDKLYSLVKTGVRQFLWAWYAEGLNSFVNALIEAAESRGHLQTALPQITKGIFCEVRTGAPRPLQALDLSFGLWIGDLEILDGWNERSAATSLNRLRQLPAVTLGARGDQLVRHGYEILIRISGKPAQEELEAVIRMAFTPPDEILQMLYNSFVALATLWKRIR